MFFNNPSLILLIFNINFKFYRKEQWQRKCLTPSIFSASSQRLEQALPRLPKPKPPSFSRLVAINHMMTRQRAYTSFSIISRWCSWMSQSVLPPRTELQNTLPLAWFYLLTLPTRYQHLWNWSPDFLKRIRHSGIWVSSPLMSPKFFSCYPHQRMQLTSSR